MTRREPTLADFDEPTMDLSEVPDVGRRESYHEGLNELEPLPGPPETMTIVLRLHVDRHSRDEAEELAAQRLAPEVYARTRSFATSRFYVFYVLD